MKPRRSSRRRGVGSSFFEGPGLSHVDRVLGDAVLEFLAMGVEREDSKSGYVR